MSGAQGLVLYVGNAESRNISVLGFDTANSTFTTLQTLSLPGAVMPLALSPDRRFLYASLRSEPYSVASLSIDPTDGTLSLLALHPMPDSMAHIATDRSGRHLFAASYGGHCASVSRIGTDGVVAAPALIVATGRNAHAAVIDPSNRYLFIPTLGSDEVMQWRFDAASGTLSPNDPPVFKARVGSGPRHLVFHPGGLHAYLMCELDAHIDTLAFDAEAGLLRAVQTLPTLPPGFTGKAWGADLHLTPDGGHLVTSERNSNTLAVFAVDAATGWLTALGHVPTETQPRGFNIDTRGRFLFVAGQLSGRVSAYAIDRDSGTLTHLTDCASGLNPNWIEVLALG